MNHETLGLMRCQCLDTNISHNSVTKYLSRGGIFIYHFIINLMSEKHLKSEQYLTNDEVEKLHVGPSGTI